MKKVVLALMALAGYLGVYANPSLVYAQGTLSLPGYNLNIQTNIFPTNMSLGQLVSLGLEVAFYLSGFLLFIWMTIGAIQYILAEGEKEKLAKARARITYAFIGFIVVMLAFLISQYIEDVLKPLPIQPTPVSVPP